MIQIALRTEYSFNAFAPIADIAKFNGNAIGIADDNSTFGHYQHYKNCKKAEVNPILGVRLMVTMFRKEKVKCWGPNYIFIAKNHSGLTEIYSLVKTAYDNFYYHPFIEMADLVEISENVIVVAEDFDIDERIDFIGISPLTTLKAMQSEIPHVALSSNRYIYPHDKHIYQLLAGIKREDQTYPQYVLDSEHHFALFGNEKAIQNTQVLADQCKVEFVPSEMIRYKGEDKLESLCTEGSKRLKIDISDGAYAERYRYEMDLIKQKDYGDYFLIVADMIRFAKKTMLVGPSRGSSAGSLVCYLIGITEVDPIEYGLLFERFIDLNREDLPDIDIDFPDVKRDKVIKYLSKIYGEDKVSHIATVAKLKPRSAINLFGKHLSVPIQACEDVKEAIIERFKGDDRADLCVTDTFETTEIGREFIDGFPKMKMAERVENHASHTGTHAAGIIVCNDPLTQYAAVNSKDNVLMLDKDEAEGLNLLKIDVLGLRTLSILEEVADRIGMKYSDYNSLPLNDPEVFKVFNEMRLFGIFQFEGYALQTITRDMGVNCFNDICAITALARPGPMQSGSTARYVKCSNGEESVEYLSNHPAFVEATRDTFGLIVYQEQFMNIARNLGNMSWKDVSKIRKAASKSLGAETFDKHSESFFEGTKKNGVGDTESRLVWETMLTFGKYGFNKSHAVAYAMVSYWTAWAKTYHPYEFAAANMNNARSEESAIKILREMVRHDGIDYKSIDPEHSIEYWDIAESSAVDADGNQYRYLVGGLTNIKGIAITKAKDIVARRASGTLTKKQTNMLANPNTPFEILFPAEHYWGMLYSDPEEFGLDTELDYIENIRDEGEYIFIGKIADKQIRDLNDFQSVAKRGGNLLDNNPLFLNMTVEDDTDSIICSVGRFQFEKWGRKIFEQSRIGYDWYLIQGNIQGSWRRINITNILNLWEWKNDE